MVTIKARTRIIALALAAAGLLVIFMTVNSRGNWDFVLPFRGRKVLALLMVGYAIAVSTVIFQSITYNRILTPSIMGFDALYLLLQTVLVFTIGSYRLLLLDERLLFGIEVLIMVLFAGLLYYWLFFLSRRSLHLLVLVGIVFGILFRSMTSLMQRLIDPSEFAVLQDLGFASFNNVNQALLLLSVLILLVISIILWRMRHVLDVLALGRESAINLGINYQKTIMLILSLVTIMVAVSTALVGPITFFGLLVANLAYMIGGSSKHGVLLPVAALSAIIALVGGQMLLEQLFQFDTSLSIIIEFVGGITFIVLLLRGAFR